MKITIHQYGGLAGTSEVLAILDVEQLGAEPQAAAREAFERLKFLARWHHPVGADFVRYELLVEDAGRQSTVSFADDGSEKAQQLVALVNQLVKAAGKKP